MSTNNSEKRGDDITPVSARDSISIEAVKLEANDDAFEVFKKNEGQVDFRTVSWIHASVIFLKGTPQPPNAFPIPDFELMGLIVS
jgi:hypothetical protein